jgi:adenylate kinase
MSVKIRKRFEEYNDKTSPLIDYYTKQGKFYPVNGIRLLRMLHKEY